MLWEVVRTKRTDKSTTGKFYARTATGEIKLELTTLENPWLNNRREVSCIPAGTYALEKRTNSEWNNRHRRKFGMNYIVGIEGVPGRDGIIIHEGNAPKDTLGCLLLGTTSGDDFIGASVSAMKKFYKLCSDTGVPEEIVISEELGDG